MSIFEGANILVSSTNYSNMGQVYLEQGELFDVVFPADSNFTIGDPVTATIYHRNGILTFQSTVIGTIDDRILMIKPSRDTSLLNRRQHTRYDVNLPARVILDEENDLQATVKDISAGGLRFQSDKYIEEGLEVDFTLGTSNFTGRGIVRRVQLREGVFEFGIEFVLTPELQRSLEQYLVRYEQVKQMSN
ncbi:PilZ domain-containing protein [Tumebacillus permanentifrigoris]|uniref:PilZ domain-containing protein n=1 Tax=Tumebacillus permanentifrigoris TaxID=378543 RepID=A0A316DR46_9BACL|nr:PilZ domain-containing protein [Tumebacillus permanentifrigoris]PWK06645.1 PilZ domain-containing protein [Tumebacillus permanentifrigoris]